jgi:hypothetical protein
MSTSLPETPSLRFSAVRDFHVEQTQRETHDWERKPASFPRRLFT